MSQENVEIVRAHLEAYLHDAPPDLGSGAILAAVIETGRGRSSGVPVRRSYAALYTVIDRKIARITIFPSRNGPSRPWASRSRRCRGVRGAPGLPA